MHHSCTNGTRSTSHLNRHFDYVSKCLPLPIAIAKMIGFFNLAWTGNTSLLPQLFKLEQCFCANDWFSTARIKPYPGELTRSCSCSATAKDSIHLREAIQFHRISFGSKSVQNWGTHADSRNDMFHFRARWSLWSSCLFLSSSQLRLLQHRPLRSIRCRRQWVDHGQLNKNCSISWVSRSASSSSPAPSSSSWWCSTTATALVHRLAHANSGYTERMALPMLSRLRSPKLLVKHTAFCSSFIPDLCKINQPWASSGNVTDAFRRHLSNI